MTINGPLDLEPWRQRLLASVPEFRQVGIATDLAAVRKAKLITPSCFIVPVSDTPASRAGAGNSVISQNINATVAIVCCVAKGRDTNLTGAEASADIQFFRRRVFPALIGWMPPGAAFSIQFAGGQLLELQDAAVLFSDRFTTGYFMRQEHQQ